jgi:hypothetical protein
MSFAPSTSLNRRIARIRRVAIGGAALALAATLLGLGACSSTKIYNWKPQARSQATTQKSQALKPGTEITPQSVLDDSAAPERQPMWVAVPAGRDGTIVWVQTTRSVSGRQ